MRLLGVELAVTSRAAGATADALPVLAQFSIVGECGYPNAVTVIAVR